jgi:hypothetical protein
MDYGTLVGPKSKPGSIRAWVNYDPIDTEGVLLDAQAYIYGAYRGREMIASAPVTIAKDSLTAALPERYLDPLTFLHADGLKIEPKHEAQLLEMRAEDAPSQPFAWTVFDELIQFECPADQAYAAKLLFYRRPHYLGAQNPTNFLTTRYPNILRVACLMHAADQIQDDAEYARWKARTDELIVRAAIENEFGARGRDYEASAR